jgi:hypothetical protein
VRDLGEIFADARAKGAFLEHLGAAKSMLVVDPKTVIEDFRNAREELDIKEERGLPLKLIDRAAKALEGIDRTSPHCKDDNVKVALVRLSNYVSEMIKDISGSAR